MRHGLLDALDHHRVAHAGDAAVAADVGGHALERHDGGRAGVLGDLGLLGVDDVHDHAALEHLGQAGLDPERRFVAHRARLYASGRRRRAEDRARLRRSAVTRVPRSSCMRPAGGRPPLPLWTPRTRRAPSAPAPRHPGSSLLQPEGLDAVLVAAGVARVDAVGERLDRARAARCASARRPASSTSSRGVICASLATSDSVASVIATVVAWRWRASFIARTTSGCGRPALRPDRRACARRSRPSAAERLLRRATRRSRRAGRAASAGGAGSEAKKAIWSVPMTSRRSASTIASIADSTSRARDLARRLLDVDVVGGERRLELVLVEREQRRGRRAAAGRRRPPRRGGGTPRAPSACSSGKPSKPSACEKRTTVERRGVRAARELLGGLEGDLVEVVDDVLRDVLLRAENSSKRAWMYAERV